MKPERKNVRLFKNPILELVSKAHPIFPICFWGPIVVLQFIWGIKSGLSLPQAFELFAGGFFFWTLFEYILHRWFFHFSPKQPWLKKIHYYVHEVHHDHYQDWYRLVAPPLMSITLSIPVYLIFYLTIGTPHIWPFFSGFLLGYLVYDYIHLYIHFKYPKHAIGKILRKHHLQHHFAWPNRWFGVSSPLWDYVFGTYVPSSERPIKVDESHNSGLVE